VQFFLPHSVDFVTRYSFSHNSNIVDDDFFEFLQEANSTLDTVNSDVDSFLNDPCRELFTLVKYPTVKQLFLQFNTALPSSAPVKCLFSLGCQIFVLRHDHLGDSNFECQLLLRGNKRFL